MRLDGITWSIPRRDMVKEEIFQGPESFTLKTNLNTVVSGYKGTAYKEKFGDFQNILVSRNFLRLKIRLKFYFRFPKKCGFLSIYFEFYFNLFYIAVR